MAESRSVVDYREEGQGAKLARKAKEFPMLPIGMAGFAIICAIGAYKFKRRGEMSPSVFLMQLRVTAQGTVVGALTLGLAYKMVQDYLVHRDGIENKEEAK